VVHNALREVDTVLGENHLQTLVDVREHALALVGHARKEGGERVVALVAMERKLGAKELLDHAGALRGSGLDRVGELDELGALLVAREARNVAVELAKDGAALLDRAVLEELDDEKAAVGRHGEVDKLALELGEDGGAHALVAKLENGLENARGVVLGGELRELAAQQVEERGDGAALRLDTVDRGARRLPQLLGGTQNVVVRLFSTTHFETLLLELTRRPLLNVLATRWRRRLARASLLIHRRSCGVSVVVACRRHENVVCSMLRR
jgi:hypothetical protein